MSDTPRTDRCMDSMTKPYENADVDVALDLCRRLERSLATKDAQIAELQAESSAFIKKYDALATAYKVANDQLNK